MRRATGALLLQRQSVLSAALLGGRTTTTTQWGALVGDGSDASYSSSAALPSHNAARIASGRECGTSVACSGAAGYSSSASSAPSPVVVGGPGSPPWTPTRLLEKRKIYQKRMRHLMQVCGVCWGGHCVQEGEEALGLNALCAWVQAGRPVGRRRSFAAVSPSTPLFRRRRRCFADAVCRCRL
jgi:hypothetical protein